MAKRDNEIAYFLSFCIELYKSHLGISGSEALVIFNHYGVTEYLSKNFDVLHTQGHNWILADIDGFISERKEAGA